MSCTKISDIRIEIMQYDRVSGVVMLHIERHLIANAMQTCPVHTTIFTTRAEDNGVLISQLILPY
jgi:hypothetical protein